MKCRGRLGRERLTQPEPNATHLCLASILLPVVALRTVALSMADISVSCIDCHTGNWTMYEENQLRGVVAEYKRLRYIYPISSQKASYRTFKDKK